MERWPRVIRLRKRKGRLRQWRPFITVLYKTSLRPVVVILYLISLDIDKQSIISVHQSLVQNIFYGYYAKLGLHLGGNYNCFGGFVKTGNSRWDVSIIATGIRRSLIGWVSNCLYCINQSVSCLDGGPRSQTSPRHEWIHTSSFSIYEILLVWLTSVIHFQTWPVGHHEANENK